MNCDEIFDLLSLYVDHEYIDEQTKAGLFAHLNECPKCARLFAALEGIHGDLAGLPALAGQEAPPELLNGVISVVNNERPNVLMPLGKNGGRGMRRLRPLALIAACLAVAFMGYFYLARPASSPDMSGSGIFISNNNSSASNNNSGAPNANDSRITAEDAGLLMAEDDAGQPEPEYNAREIEAALDALVGQPPPGGSKNVYSIEWYYLIKSDHVAPELLRQLIDDYGLVGDGDDYWAVLELEPLYQAYLLLTENGIDVSVIKGGGDDAGINTLHIGLAK